VRHFLYIVRVCVDYIICIQRTCIHTYTHAQIHTYRHTHILIQMPISLCETMHKCVCACMHVYHKQMHRRLHICVCARMYVRMYVTSKCLGVSINVHIMHFCVRKHGCPTYTLWHNICLYINTYKHVKTCIGNGLFSFVYMTIKAYMYVWNVYVCMHMYSMFMCVHIRINIRHECTHTHIHTYMHGCVHTLYTYRDKHKTSIHTRTCMHACLRACIHTCMHTYEKAKVVFTWSCIDSAIGIKCACICCCS
jgi:hypothetical protein